MVSVVPYKDFYIHDGDGDGYFDLKNPVDRIFDQDGIELTTSQTLAQDQSLSQVLKIKTPNQDEMSRLPIAMGTMSGLPPPQPVHGPPLPLDGCRALIQGAVAFALIGTVAVVWIVDRHNRKKMDVDKDATAEPVDEPFYDDGIYEYEDGTYSELPEDSTFEKGDEQE